MEMPVDREDFDFEVFETDDVTRDKKPKRLVEAGSGRA